MSIPCDVVILPDEILANKAIASSNVLKDFDSLFVLEDGKYYPHASLYMLQLAEDEVDRAKTLLSDIARHARKLTLEASRYDHTLGFVDTEYQRTLSLDNLQHVVVAALNPVRDGMREKDKERMVEATGLALENYKDYGYKYVGELFRPHITISRLTGQKPEALNGLGDLAQYSGSFSKIGLFEMGDNGTCIRKIGSWELQ
jgi:hypothetical protein